MVKRITDIIGATLGMLLFAPVLALIAWKVHRQIGAPILFRQSRPGWYGKPFEMIKFRTMTEARGFDGASCRCRTADPFWQLVALDKS